MTQQVKKPNFYILGAAKAGTTSLYDILCQHPQVYMPFDKEPAFFCDDQYFSRGENWYLNTFFGKAKNQTLRGEATSRYLYFGKKAAPRIQAFSQPDQPKFIAIFRDPAKLVYSFYWNSVREGKEHLPFPEALQAEQHRMVELQAQLEINGQILFAYSKIGAYARQISEYLEIFPKENFLFFLTEDLGDFSLLVNQLQGFLNLDDQSSLIKPTNSNQSALPKNRTIHQWLRNRSRLKDMLKLFLPYPIRYKLKMATLEKNLREFAPPQMDAEIANSIRKHYSEDTLQLQDIIQRDLSSWLPA